jgi:hypothetical protein
MGKKERKGASQPSVASPALYAGLVAVVGVLAYLALRSSISEAEADFRRSLSPGADDYNNFFACKDGAKKCPEVESRCDEVSSFGAVVRSSCAKTCGFCLGTGTAKGNFNGRRESILAELESLDAQERLHNGPKPEVQVRYVGPEKEPILVVDNFLPASVVNRAMMSAVQSPLWRPVAKQHLEQWDQQKMHKNMPQDQHGRFAPKGLPAESFPGVRSPLNNRYEELMWARLEQLRGRAPMVEEFGDQTSRNVLQRTKNEWVSGVTGVGITCFSPHSLDIGNCKPHVDTINSEFAILHYMSPTNWTSAGSGEAELEYGGTAFYKEKRTGTANFMPRHCDKLSAKGGSMYCKGSLFFNCVNQKRQQGGKMAPACDSFSAAEIDMWGIPKNPSYFGAGTDADFELQEYVKYKFNRVVMYSPKQLHDRYLNEVAIEALSCDPEVGRITGHFFLS